MEDERQAGFLPPRANKATQANATSEYTRSAASAGCDFVAGKDRLVEQIFLLQSRLIT